MILYYVITGSFRPVYLPEILQYLVFILLQLLLLFTFTFYISATIVTGD